MLHLILHFLVPLFIAAVFFKNTNAKTLPSKKYKLPGWLSIWALMMLTMLVDIDHLIASPIYQTDRCSIGFHPLHTFIPIAIYLTFCFYKNTRVIGLGLIIHMALDSIDCQINIGVWYV